MYGTVTRYDKNRGFGFIYAQDLIRGMMLLMH